MAITTVVAIIKEKYIFVTKVKHSRSISGNKYLRIIINQAKYNKILAVKKVNHFATFILLPENYRNITPNRTKTV